MTGTKKNKRNKKNKSTRPSNGRSLKPKNRPQGMTVDIAFTNLDSVCSKYMGSREDHIQLQLSITILKGKVKALGMAESRIKELEAELAGLEAEYDDESGISAEDDDDDEGDDEGRDDDDDAADDEDDEDDDDDDDDDEGDEGE